MSIGLIDVTKEEACRTAEANTIRAKTGDSTQIAYDFANGKGFADAIAAIPTGGGGSAVQSGSFTAGTTTSTWTITVTSGFTHFYIMDATFDSLDTGTGNRMLAGYAEGTSSSADVPYVYIIRTNSSDASRAVSTNTTAAAITQQGAIDNKSLGKFTTGRTYQWFAW